jgi:hypothetical protein
MDALSRFMSRRIAGRLQESLEILGKIAQQAQHAHC